jgi:hypothetical protein
MSANTYDAPDFVVEAGRTFVPVAWEHADRLRSRLDKLGVTAVVELNPATHEARVQVPAGTDPVALREAMDAMDRPL